MLKGMFRKWMEEEIERINRRKRFRRKASMISRDWTCYIDGCTRSYGSEGALKNHFRLKHADVTYNRKLLSLPASASRDVDDNSSEDRDDDNEYIPIPSYWRSPSEDGEGSVLTQLQLGAKRRSVVAASDPDRSAGLTTVPDDLDQDSSSISSPCGPVVEGKPNLISSAPPVKLPSVIAPTPLPLYSPSQGAVSAGIANSPPMPVFGGFRSGAFGVPSSQVPTQPIPGATVIPPNVPNQPNWSYTSGGAYHPYSSYLLQNPTGARYVPLGAAPVARVPVATPIRQLAPVVPLTKFEPDVNK